MQLPRPLPYYGKFNTANIDGCLKQLNSMATAVNLVGFDVTGMPPSNNSESDHNVAVNTVKHFYDEYRKVPTL
jgi:hypothetical protein